MSNFENLYYNNLIFLDFNTKLQKDNFDINEQFKKVVISSFLSKKKRNIESSLVKLNALLTKINKNTKPYIYVTTSYMVLKSNFKSLNRNDSFFYFLLNYLKDTGKYTLSNFFIKNKELSFTFNDYNYLSNFLGLGYDFFGWKNTLRVVVIFKDNNLSILKMLLLSSIL